MHIVPRPGPKLKPPPSELGRLYVNEQMSAQDIMKRFGVSEKMVYLWLREYGIRRRPDSRRPTADDLHRLYVVEQRSRTEIARDMGVYVSLVERWLEDAGISLRRRNFTAECIVCGRPADKELRRRRDCCWWPCFNYFEQAAFDVDLARLIHAHHELRRTLSDVGR